MDLAHLKKGLLRLFFYSAVNQLITDKTQNNFYNLKQYRQGKHGVTVIVSGNEHGDPSSNHGQSRLRFTFGVMQLHNA